MEPITILLLILAAIFLLLSCLLPEKKEEKLLSLDEELIAKLARRELTPEEVMRIRETVDRVISEKTEETILKTDDYLSKVANEKIMAVDEFSKQIMERLEKDNSDATFLYKMIADAKEELKSDIAQARKEELALEKLLEEKKEAETEAEEKKKAVPEPKKRASGKNTSARAESSAKAKASAMTRMEEEELERMKRRRLTMPVSENAKKLQTRVTFENKEDTTDRKPDDIAHLIEEYYGPEDAGQELPKDKILELHKKGYSVREISKELAMGQGEVKLVIELYGA